MLKLCFAVLLMATSLTDMVKAGDRPLPIVKLSILDHVAIVELADTAAARTAGLMHRTYLPEDSGMLFVFPVAGIHCMWMKDTALPLSVAFLNEVKEIIDIAEMTPETLIPHCSSRAARYALEMNTGWFKERKIQVGDQVVETINSGNMR